MENEKITLVNLDNKLDNITVLIKEYHGSTEKRFEQIDRRFEKIDRRLDSMDERFDSMDERFDRMDERFDSMDERFDRMDERFDRMDERFEKNEGYLAALKNGQKAIRMDISKMSQKLDETYKLAVVTWGEHEESKARLGLLEK